ncbi:14916_t:CDS:2, partial [Racocetra fulgida]
EFLILLAELQKICPRNLENIKFIDGKAEITRNFTNLSQKNLRNKKFQSFNESVDIPTDSNASITIKYEIKQHTPAGQKLQMQPPTPLMFSEMSIEDPDKIWESVNSKLHSVFGYGEKLESQNEDDKRYCLLLLSVLQNWAFADKYPVDLWLKKAANTFGKELKQLRNFNEVQKPSIADALLSSDVEVSHSTNQLVISENNNSIEFGDDINSITMGINQWKKKDAFLNKIEKSLILGKLNHFFNLTKAYAALQKLVIQDPPRGNKSKTIKYKIANSILLGEKSTSKNFFKKMSLIVLQQFYKRIRRNENARFIVDNADGSDDSDDSDDN